MDSRLLIGPGIPTPDPTARAPWYISSISPHRLVELSPVATAVSIPVLLCVTLVFYCVEGNPPLGVAAGELRCASAMPLACKLSRRSWHAVQEIMILDDADDTQGFTLHPRADAM